MKQQNKSLIDLGKATVETKGGPVGKDDSLRGFISAVGLSGD